MNIKLTPQEKRRARVARAAASRTLRRYRAIKKQIPRDWPEDVQAACRRYIQNVLSLGIGKNTLALVVWPWESRPLRPLRQFEIARMEQAGIPTDGAPPRVLRGRPR